MALSVRAFVGHLIGQDRSLPAEGHDTLVTFVPARPVRRGIPDEYMERSVAFARATSDQTPATKTSPAEIARPPEDLLRETLLNLPYSF
jgi:hypothetical protein